MAYVVEATPGCGDGEAALTVLEVADDATGVALPDGIGEAVYSVANADAWRIGYASREPLQLARAHDGSNRVRFDFSESAIYCYQAGQPLWYALVPFTAIVDAPFATVGAIGLFLACPFASFECLHH